MMGYTEKLEWIPIKTRPMTEEERQYWGDHLGYELSDEDAVTFDCKMPNDGERILLSHEKWVCIDKFFIDGGGCCLAADDWDDVIAWMPLPEPYGGEQDE